MSAAGRTETASDAVLILGAGVIGLSSALVLLEAGISVRILDRIGPGAGASHGNCGLISPSHAAPLAVPGLLPTALLWSLRRDAPLHIAPTLDPQRLYWLWRFARRCNWSDFHASAAAKHLLLQHSRARFGELQARAGIDCEFAPVGHLSVSRNARAFARSAWIPRTLERLGIEVEVLDGAAAQALEPALKPGLAGGYYTTQDAHLRPDLLVAGLTRRVQALGGVVEAPCEVKGWLRRGGRVCGVVTEQGERRADRIVLALGAWSPQLAAQLPWRLPIQSAKGYSITMSRPARCPRLSIVLKDRGVAVTPWPSGYRLGSTYEFSGLNSSENPLRTQALRRAAQEYLHDPLGAELQETWHGFRPMTWDGLPLIGRVPGHSELWINAGHGTLGVSMSLASADLLAALMLERPPPIAAAPYAPERFSQGR